MVALRLPVFVDVTFLRSSSAGATLKVSGGHLRFATWNAEGLAQSKIMELQWHMQQQAIDIVCVQDTHREDSDVQITDAGFLLMFSGQAETKVAETAGVGCLLSPHVRRNLVGWQQLSARMASWQLGALQHVCTSHRQRFCRETSLFQNVAT